MDASFQAVAYVSYLKSVNVCNEVHVSFVCANSKLAPRSTASVPRLELCAALEGALATIEICRQLQLGDTEVRLFSDSAVTLVYLTNQAKHFSKYVSRRVSLITKCFPAAAWSYIPTELNPADLATRPQLPEVLGSSNWISGTDFLQQLNNVYFRFNCIQKPFRPNVSSLLQLLVQVFFNLMKRLSCWTRVKQVCLLVLKFCHIMNNQTSTVGTNPILTLIRDVQSQSFFQEKLQLADNKLAKDKKLLQLSPFLDNNDIIRVGGRLSNAELPFHEKHPVIIPADHPVAVLLVNHFHSKSHHQGRLITAGAVRSGGFFVQHGTKVIKKVISSCFQCKRLRRPTEDQVMSDLPSERLIESPPFTYAGLDVCGPFVVTQGCSTRKTRGTFKVWALVITCLASRATHIEPLPSLDTSTFINAYRRFVSIRGECRYLRSDRGTNFVSARSEDRNFSFAVFQKELDGHHTRWEMNPPHASHYGGVWERKIGSLKRILDATFTQLGQRS